MAASHDALAPLAGASNEVLDAVLRLNQVHVTELSDLDAAALDRLVCEAFFTSVVNGGDAFLIAFDQEADYDSPNFRWFQARYGRFVYVDRIVVAAPARGRGLAKRLYESLFESACAKGQSIIACEVNHAPSNPASDAFHRAQGFEEVGRADLASGKTVRYLVKRLNTPGRAYRRRPLQTSATGGKRTLASH